MTFTKPTIDDILTAHFTAAFEGVAGIRRKRLELINEHLRAYLETDGIHILEGVDRELIQRELEFGTVEPVAHTMHADDLVFGLTCWTREPWLLTDPALLRVQLSTAEALITTVLQQRLVSYDDLACQLMDIKYAVRTGRASLRAAR